MSYTTIIAALILSITVISGLANINFQHNLHLPAILSVNDVITTERSFSVYPPVMSTITHIRIQNELKDTDTIKNILKVLQEAKNGDKIIFHLAGFGGHADSLYMLVNNIKISKAYVIMSVEAPVYSAHAYLALFGDELKISKYSFLMLHNSTAVNIDCSTAQGIDRGVSNIEHCERYKAAHMVIMTGLILFAPLLTDAERWEILSGHSVYLSSYILESRITSLQNNEDIDNDE